MRIHANIRHLIGRLNQLAADGFLPLRVNGRSLMGITTSPLGMKGT
jgi:hypothetical protein